jgi:hypothetical protein
MDNPDKKKLVIIKQKSREYSYKRKLVNAESNSNSDQSYFLLKLHVDHKFELTREHKETLFIQNENAIP